jgi:hypothetical protein
MCSEICSLAKSTFGPSEAMRGNLTLFNRGRLPSMKVTRTPKGSIHGSTALARQLALC